MRSVSNNQPTDGIPRNSLVWKGKPKTRDADALGRFVYTVNADDSSISMFTAKLEPNRRGYVDELVHPIRTVAFTTSERPIQTLGELEWRARSRDDSRRLPAIL